MNNRPIHEVQLGSIKAAVWRNADGIGGARFTVTFSRIYKEGDAWRSTESFGRDDLLLVSKAADHAHFWIYQQEQKLDVTKYQLITKPGGKCDSVPIGSLYANK